MREYRPHQVPMHDYFVDFKSPALLVEMRLGKTLVTIRGLIEKGYEKILINAPKSAMISWKNELAKEGERWASAYGVPAEVRERRVINAFERPGRVWVLMNYEGYRSVPEISDMPWHAVIADESVKIKNPKAKVSYTLTKKFRNADCRAILTGLIAPESELDLYMQFAFLQGTFMGCYSYWNFREKFFEPDPTGYNWIPRKGVRKLLQEVLQEKAFILTRKQAGVDRQKFNEIISVPMNAVQKKLYNQIEKDFCWECGEYGAETMWATEKDIWRHRVAGGFTPDKHNISDAKSAAIYELLTGNLKGQSVVIWYRFRAELEWDFNYLTSRGIKCSLMTGKMKTSILEENEVNFQNGITQVMLCMEKVGAYSKDFSVASTAIYRSNEYSCDLRTQSEDRILSLAKTDSLLLIELITEDTVEEDAVQAVQEKQFDAKELMTKTLDRRKRELA